jgi:CHAT domain-containing protein/tetratricopeptide (TPR) repeat protein
MDLSLVCIVLGNLCLRHGDLMDSVRTLRRADDAYLRALRAIDGNQARYYRALCQHNRGVVLRKLFTLTKNEKFLQDGEEAYRFALQECSRDLTPLDWAMTQLGLANIIHDIWKITGDSQRIKEAEDAYWGALEIAETSSADELRQHIARALISLLVSRSRFRDAISVITPTLARSDAVMIDAFRSRDGAARAVELVSDLYGMSSECLLRQEEPDSVGALIVAEAGRARFFANSSAISAVQPKLLSDSGLRDLMERAFERRASLRVRLGYDESIKHTERAALSATERRLLQDKLLKATDDYVSLCREHGLIVTPEPLTLADIQAAVPDGGALVLPVLTEQAAFVFILTDSGAPEVVELPGLDRRAVVAHLSGETNWLGVYNRHFGDYEGKDPAASAVWGQCLTGTLAWLWERLLAPIHVHLRDVARLAANAPIVLLPPGLLGVLPLHAAGPGPDGRCFGDHWTVSYAPSVRSLLTCQDRRDARASQPARLLAAIDPDGSLSGARAEGPMLQQRFAAPGREPVVMTGKEATIARILGELPNATVFHASTHGTHDPVEPARSGLLLADGALELDMLRHARLDAMRLVFLSACESGLAGVRRLPEEFIGLPTGLVEAGAAAVVGSLWPIGDISAFLLARRFYDLMYDAAGEECMAPATALREACAWLRGVTFGELKREFPLVQLPSGPALVLRSARMMPGALEPDRPAPPEAPHLPLGLDDERPFAHPTHWAAFTITGC